MLTPIEKLYLEVTEENLLAIKKKQKKIIKRNDKLINDIEKAHKKASKSKLKFDRKKYGK